MKFGHTIALACIAFTLAGGALALDVEIDYDKAANFDAIKTFSVEIGTSWGNPIGEKRVTEVITEALTAKGWTLAEVSEADARVVLHGASQTKHSLNTFYSGTTRYGYGYGWRGVGPVGMSTATTTVSEYTIGTLVVDIFDAKSKELMWRGIAQDQLSEKTEKNIKKLNKASDKLFKDFPPGSVKD